MNANDVLQRIASKNPITDKSFNELIKEFAEDYFKDRDYYKQIEDHRNPVEVAVKMEQRCGDLIQAIDQRPEMRDFFLPVVSLRTVSAHVSMQSIVSGNGTLGA